MTNIPSKDTTPRNSITRLPLQLLGNHRWRKSLCSSLASRLPEHCPSKANRASQQWGDHAASATKGLHYLSPSSWEGGMVGLHHWTCPSSPTTLETFHQVLSWMNWVGGRAACSDWLHPHMCCPQQDPAAG